jgi:general secretion pathway protein G
MPKPCPIQTPAAVERERDPRRGEAGFTLLELLVVLVILALIAGLAAPRVLNLLGGARSDAAAIQIDTLANILDLYRLEVGHFPSEDEGIEALIEPPPGVERWNGPYVRKRDQLIDPWGRAFEYRYPGEHGDYDIFSLGADGVEGGDGEDADVISW